MRSAKIGGVFLATGLLAGSLSAGCGGMSGMPDGTSPAGHVLAGQATRSGEAFDRTTVIARSAEILCDAAREGDGDTLRWFDTYARGADPDPAATQEMARRALARIDAERVAVQPAQRQLLRGVAEHRFGVKAPAPAQPIAFPRDEGAHWSAITEWWYLNGHVAQGKDRFGYEFTLFRVGPVLMWAHVALTDERGQAFRYSRDWYFPGRTHSASDKLDTRYGAQAIKAIGAGKYHLAGVASKEAAFDLDLTSKKTPLLINGDGNIDMPEGKDSRYYSLTRLDSVGSVRMGDRRFEVKGLSWLDHQWGPFYVSGFRERWDWYSVQADDGTDYNLFAFRAADGTPLARHVNTLDASGTFRGGGRFEIDRNAWFVSPRTGLRYATKWVLTLPEARERLTLEATVPDQELSRFLAFPFDPLPQYWEGSMNVVKTRADGRKVGGVGYTETFGFPR